MESGIEKSIDEILERAEYQRDNLLEQIDYFLEKRFPVALENASKNIEAFKRIAKSQKIDIELNNIMQESVEVFIEKLKSLKNRLSQINFTEEGVLTDFSMENTEETLKLIEPALEKEMTNLINLAETKISEAVKQKIEKEEQIQELKEKRAYLKGILDNTRGKRKKAAIQSQISNIDIQIENLSNPVNKSNDFKERIANHNSSNEEPTKTDPKDTQKDTQQSTPPSHEEK